MGRSEYTAGYVKGSGKMMDRTDMEIIRLLLGNARMQWQEIGEIVHLTGQAVKNRIDRLEKAGIIEGYTVKLDPVKMGLETTAFITVFMKTTDHAAFKRFMSASSLVEEAHRISGDGCYLLKVRTEGGQELDAFLDSLLTYGNYKVNLSISRAK